MLAELAATVEVDLMPGENDPTNFTMPQQPFNPCLIPIAKKYSTLSCVTNPHAVQINHVKYYFYILFLLLNHQSI